MQSASADSLHSGPANRNWMKSYESAWRKSGLTAYLYETSALEMSVVRLALLKRVNLITVSDQAIAYRWCTCIFLQVLPTSQHHLKPAWRQLRRAPRRIVHSWSWANGKRLHVSHLYQNVVSALGTVVSKRLSRREPDDLKHTTDQQPHPIHGLHTNWAATNSMSLVKRKDSGPVLTRGTTAGQWDLILVEQHLLPLRLANHEPYL